MNEQISFFEKHYTIINNIHVLPDGEKIFIGDKSHRTCRYCGKKKPEVTFKKIAHAVPEFIGNKRLFAYDECDTCNDLFGRNIEDHFSKFLGAGRTLAQVRGKKGVPTYRSKQKKSRIELQKQGLTIKEYEDHPLCEIDEENNQLKIFVNQSPYIPAAVFKCMVKISLAVVATDELVNFRETIQWIRKEKHKKEDLPYSPLVALHTFVPGPYPHEGIKLLNLKRKSDSFQVPYLISILAFSNFIYQISVPSIEKDKGLFGSEVKLSYFPTPFDMNHPYGEAKRKVLDLSSYELTENMVRPVTMHFDRIEKHQIYLPNKGINSDIKKRRSTF